MMDDFMPGSYKRTQFPECWLCNNIHPQRMFHGKTMATGSFSWFLKISLWGTIHQREKKNWRPFLFLKWECHGVDDEFVYGKRLKEGGLRSLASIRRTPLWKEDRQGCDGCIWLLDSCVQKVVEKSWPMAMSREAEFMNLNQTQPSRA